MSAHPIAKLILDSLIADPPNGYTLDPKQRSTLISQLNNPSAGTAAVTALYQTVAVLSRSSAKPAATELLNLVMDAIDIAPKHRAAAAWGARR